MVTTFPFRFDARYRPLARLLGITEESASVTVDKTLLRARFGRWRVTTPLANITRAELTGPYRVWRTVGPARMGLSDHGLTFATNPDRGVLLHFAEPVRGMTANGSLRHPNLTLTVADVNGLLSAVQPG